MALATDDPSLIEKQGDFLPDRDENERRHSARGGENHPPARGRQLVFPPSTSLSFAARWLLLHSRMSTIRTLRLAGQARGRDQLAENRGDLPQADRTHCVNLTRLGGGDPAPSIFARFRATRLRL